MIKVSHPSVVDVGSIPGLENFKFIKIDGPTFLGKDLLGYSVRLRVFQNQKSMVETLLATIGSVYIRDCREINGQYHLRWAVVTEKPLDLIFDLDVRPGVHHEFLTPVYNISLAVNRENADDLRAAHGESELEKQLAGSISRAVSLIVKRMS